MGKSKELDGVQKGKEPVKVLGPKEAFSYSTQYLNIYYLIKLNIYILPLPAKTKQKRAPRQPTFIHQSDRAW